MSWLGRIWTTLREICFFASFLRVRREDHFHICNFMLNYSQQPLSLAQRLEKGKRLPWLCLTVTKSAYQHLQSALI